MRNKYADIRSRLWDRHDIILEGKATRTAFGTTHAPPIVVRGSVQVAARTVKNEHGEDEVVAATLRWHPDGPLPNIGDLVTLPEYFGVKPSRRVVTVGRAITGTGLTPDHVEVTVV